MVGAALGTTFNQAAENGLIDLFNFFSNPFIGFSQTFLSQKGFGNGFNDFFPFELYRASVSTTVCGSNVRAADASAPA
jgi:hypothetical protein